MKIDLIKFTQVIDSMEDIESSAESQEYHELMGILSGNKTCIENVSLEGLAYYIENLESIIRVPNWDRCFNIQFLGLPQAKICLRRGI